jgi:exopolysaccharide biosynthesis protein
VRQVARGVELVQEITPDGAAGGPLVVNVLRIDPKAKGVRITAALGQDRVWGRDPTFGREAVSTLAERRKAVAGVNAGFFPFAGNPIGLHVEGGGMVTEPANRRTVFVITKRGEPRFEAFTFAGSVKAGGETAGLDGMNRRPGKGNEMLLFSPLFFDTTLRQPGRVEVVVTGIKGPLSPGAEYGGTVARVTEGGGTPLAPDTVVLSGGGTDAEFLRRAAAVGAKVSFRLDVSTVSGRSFDAGEIREAVAGGPRLLTDGRVTIALTEEGFDAAFSTTRHPRTAVGVTDDGKILLVTVDGRQKALSRGVSLPELAALLLRLGAREAVNLDGGGSTAMVVRDSVVDSPSEGKERPVADALLVFAEGNADNSTPSDLLAPPSALRVGETWSAAAPASARERETDVWGTRGGVGFVSQEGVFRALRPGTGEIRRTGANGRAATVPIIVAGTSQGDSPGFKAILALLPDPSGEDRAMVRIRVANAEGDALGGEPVAVIVTGGSPVPVTVITDPKGEAIVRVQWDGKADPANQSVAVSSPAKRFTGGRLSRPPAQ